MSDEQDQGASLRDRAATPRGPSPAVSGIAGIPSALEPWPGYEEQSWFERYSELDRRYEALQAKLLRLATNAAFVKALVAQGIEAGTDETPQAAQPEGREPDPEGDAPVTPPPGEPS